MVRLKPVGMDSVTSKFKKYDLSEICSKHIFQSDPNHSVPSLPKYVGGSGVLLLLGIKNTNLYPVWIKTLPCGVAVYQSVFKDIWGSDLIFAGPHESFTNGNKFSNANHVIFGIHSANRKTEEEEKRADEGQYAMITDVELGLTVHRFPINPQDILNVGGIVVPDFEELIESSNHVLEELDPSHSQHYCGVHKASIPIARMRELIDEDDTADTITYRCPECSKCVVCKRSCRRTAISLQESVEQGIIEASVKLDLENGRVVVNLPWIREPVQPLIEKHRGNSNIHQVLRLYKTQCTKSQEVKEKIRIAHEELVEQNIMTKLTDLPEQLQEVIKSAEFNHYYCWRVVYKEDSQSTPVRLVVDPTMSGLNILLANGENNLGKIFDILTQSWINQY